MIKKLNQTQLQKISSGNGSYCKFPDKKILVCTLNIEKQEATWTLFDDITRASEFFPDIEVGNSFRILCRYPSKRLVGFREQIEKGNTNYYIETNLLDS